MTGNCGLGELQVQMFEIARSVQAPAGTATHLVMLLNEAYALGRADRERELALMTPEQRALKLSLARHPAKGIRVFDLKDPEQAAEFSRLRGPVPALSDDDSEAEAEAAGRLAGFGWQVTDTLPPG